MSVFLYVCVRPQSRSPHVQPAGQNSPNRVYVLCDKMTRWTLCMQHFTNICSINVTETLTRDSYYPVSHHSTICMLTNPSQRCFHAASNWIYSNLTWIKTEKKAGKGRWPTTEYMREDTDGNQEVKVVVWASETWSVHPLTLHYSVQLTGLLNVVPPSDMLPWNQTAGLQVWEMFSINSKGPQDLSWSHLNRHHPQKHVKLWEFKEILPSTVRTLQLG